MDDYLAWIDESEDLDFLDVLCRISPHEQEEYPAFQ